MLILAFDTATDLATSALVADGETLGERVTRPQALLADVDALLAAAGVVPRRPDGNRRRTGPGQLHRHPDRALGRARARTLARPPGCRCLDARGARRRRSDDAFPVIDARRGEVFVLGPRAVRTRGRRHPAGEHLRRRRRRSIPRSAGRAWGRGAAGRLRAPSAARLAARLARRLFGPADAVEPVYVREPDAKRWVA